MISIPDYLNVGVDQFSGQLQDLDNLTKRVPTNLEALTDGDLNSQWHELMSEEDQLMIQLNEMKSFLDNYKVEMNRRIFRRTVEACISSYESIAE